MHAQLLEGANVFSFGTSHDIPLFVFEEILASLGILSIWYHLVL